MTITWLYVTLSYSMDAYMGTTQLLYGYYMVKTWDMLQHVVVVARGRETVVKRPTTQREGGGVELDKSRGTRSTPYAERTRNPHDAQVQALSRRTPPSLPPNHSTIRTPPYPITRPPALFSLVTYPLVQFSLSPPPPPNPI